MTALDRYVRLESEALWRAEPNGQRRDVTLSFGDATLVIADATGRPLAHWSLPALIRQNPDDVPALYAPDEDASEILEIADPTMVEAIEEVQRALAKSRPRPGKLRHWLTGGITAATLGLAIFWLPDALNRQALAVVPAPKRAAIGAEMLDTVRNQTGAVCQSPRANAAASRLAQRIFGAGTTQQVLVVPSLAQGAVSLPGNLILLDYDLLRTADDPAVAAGFLIAAHAAAAENDPLADLLKQAGLTTTFRLLTTGEIPNDILRERANAMLNDGTVAPSADGLRGALAAAQIPQAPYLAAVDARTGNMPDLGTDPMADEVIPLILRDSDWVSLRNICNV